MRSSNCEGSCSTHLLQLSSKHLELLLRRTRPGTFGCAASEGGAVGAGARSPRRAGSQPRQPRNDPPRRAGNMMSILVSVSEVPDSLVERMRGFGTTIFAEMSALAVAHRRDQPGPGLSGDGRPARGAGGGDRGDHRRCPQPVPARPGLSRAAPGDRRAPAAVLRAGVRRGDRDPGDRRRDRGDRRDHHGAGRSG